MELDIEDASTGVSNTDEVILELIVVLRQFSTRVMGEDILFLEGRKSMLSDVIDYLEKTL